MELTQLKTLALVTDCFAFVHTPAIKPETDSTKWASKTLATKPGVG